jgi:hypothetical protein
MQWQDILSLFPASSLTPAEILVSLGISLLGALVVLWLYQAYYASQHMGAGVHRTFLLGGPAITAMFLAIQFSLPLSLGLLGALAFVRFRVPLKDPAEVGFLLLMIATSLASATFNYWLPGVLLPLAFLTLSVQHLAGGRLVWRRRTYLLVSLDGPEGLNVEKALSAFLSRRLPSLRLESVSDIDGRLSFHYQFTRRGKMDWGAFLRETNEVVAPARVNILVS